MLEYTVMCPKDSEGMANSVDPDQIADLYVQTLWIISISKKHFNDKVVMDTYIFQNTS